MKKIQIIGFAGSGKSTLAGTLAERFSLPVLYLDTVFWLPGWQMRSREEQRKIVADFLAAHPDGWVIDGNYSKNHFDERMKEADIIIFLNFNRWRCLWRIVKRRIMFKGKTRASMTEGCDEKISFDFLKAAFWTSRLPKATEKFKNIRAHYADKLVELKNPRQVDEFLSKL